MLKFLFLKRLKSEFIKFKRNHFDGYSLKSYSQEGEDMILRRLFEEQQTGFYVDVGAHHPMRFSNTYFFYKNGWNGINIDAMPNSMRLFNTKRSRDINIEWILYNKNYKELCQNARKKVLQEFDSTIVSQRYIDLYKNILKNV